MKCVETYNLSKKYNGKVAVDNLNISIYKGEVFGFLGEDGAGKTTIIEMLTAKINPTNGTATVLDRDLIKEPFYIKRKLSSFCKIEKLFMSMTLYTYLYGYFLINKLSFRKAKKSTDKFIEEYSLIDYLNMSINKLSYSIKRKIEFAKVLEKNSDLILLDEPTNQTEYETKELIYNNILKCKSKGKTIIIASKSIEEIDRLCDRVCFIKKGKCLGVYVLRSIKEKYSKDKVRIYIEFNSFIDKEKFKLLKKNKFILEDNEFYIDVDLSIKNNFINVINKISKLNLIIIDIQLVEPSLEEIYDEIMNKTKFKEVLL